MSGMSDQSLAVFSQDAWRLLHESQDCVKRLTDLPAPDSSSLLWIELLEKIHTLKGTASMLQKTAPLADVLHALDGSLVVRTRESTPKLDQIKATLQEAQTTLSALGFPEPETPNTTRELPKTAVSGATRGLLIACQDQEYWIPLDSVLRVFTENEIDGKKFIYLDGTWLPVIGPNRCHAAIAVWCTHGKLIVRVERVFGVFQLNHDRLKTADRIWEPALFCQRSVA